MRKLIALSILGYLWMCGPSFACTEGEIRLQADNKLYKCHSNKWMRYDPNNLIIMVSARYQSSDGRGMDVIGHFKSECDDTSACQVKISNTNFGRDPAYGAPKHVAVQWRCGANQTVHAEAQNESTTFKIYCAR
jgi:hypothetical protein